ncbi:carbohydrate kinase family protein [Saccharomonospora saliphila]|uniref:carbohydrate kinase family protein n=1 Tax=Saccharomonospora saliphila TaxID=369829 RepID=UPI00037FE1AF|nr:carbohydrate kinase [Saccharomonospora saliphila]
MSAAREPVVAVAGEAIVDLLVGEDPRHPVAAPGGGPANTAITLGRLGTPVTFLGRFGDDRFGALLREHLRDNRVDLGHAVAAPEPASLAVVTAGAAHDVTYGFHVTGTADWHWSAAELPALPESVRAVHTGSLALALPPGADVLARWFTECRARHVTSLDPNIRPALAGCRAGYRQRLEALVAASDVVKVSAEDLAWVYPGEDPVVAAERWRRDLGPVLVVVTLGGDGAVAVHAGRTVRVRARTMPVADTVGAGDAFSGGLLDWLSTQDCLDRARLRGLSRTELERALAHAGLVAGLTCTRPGAQPPWRTEIATGPGEEARA